MKLQQIKNQLFEGYNKRLTTLDEIFLDRGAKMPILIFAHGLKGFKDWGHFPAISKTFAEAGFYVLTFNFSHNGGTIENPVDFPDLEAFSNNSYWRELKDVEKLLEWIVNDSEIQSKGGDLNSINILGHSQGGGISLVAAYLYPKIKKVITWAAISSFEERLPPTEQLEEWKLSGVRLVENTRTKQQMPLKYQFVEEFRKHANLLNIQHAVSNLNIPQLIVHGSTDLSVDIESANQLKNWNPDAQLEIIDGAEHMLGGKHPWTDAELPEVTKAAIEKSIQFLKSN